MVNPLELAAVAEEAIPLVARAGARLLAESGWASKIGGVAARAIVDTEESGLTSLITREPLFVPKFSPSGPFHFDTSALPGDRNSPLFQELVTKQLGLDQAKLDAGQVAVLHPRVTQQAGDFMAGLGKHDLGMWGSSEQGLGVVEYKSLPSTRGYLNPAPSVVRITKTLDCGLPVGQADRAGTGVFVKGNGTIATNEHVVRDAASLTVQTQDGRTFAAEVLSVDTPNDLAIVKLSDVQAGTKFPVPKFVDTEDLFKNARVAAVGHHGALKGLVASPGQFTGLSNWGKGQYAIDGIFKGASVSGIFDGNGGLVGLVAKVHPTIAGRVSGPTADLIRQKLYSLVGG